MNLKSMTLPELTAVLKKELGQPAFRAKTGLHLASQGRPAPMTK